MVTRPLTHMIAWAAVLFLSVCFSSLSPHNCLFAMLLFVHCQTWMRGRFVREKEAQRDSECGASSLSKHPTSLESSHQRSDRRVWWPSLKAERFVELIKTSANLLSQFNVPPLNSFKRYAVKKLSFLPPCSKSGTQSVHLLVSLV